MSDKITEVVIPILLGLQADMAVVKADVAVLKADVATLKADVATLKADVFMLKESVRRIDARMGGMESFMVGYHASLHAHGVELNIQRERLDDLQALVRQNQVGE